MEMGQRDGPPLGREEAISSWLQFKLLMRVGHNPGNCPPFWHRLFVLQKLLPEPGILWAMVMAPPHDQGQLRKAALEIH